jgi:queuine tRNA-ribosyltransferase
MPVGTAGTVKTMTSAELEELGFKLVLANTYHLHLRPGDELVRELGGLHRFMGWSGAILTDSGGYQVFSLSTLRTVSEEGVAFRSHIDGRPLLLTPELSVDVQKNLGSDVVMAFDECIPYPAERSFVKLATERSLRWTARSHRRFAEPASRVSSRGGAGTPYGAGAHGDAPLPGAGPGGALFFGIVQGGMMSDLRRFSAEGVGALDPAGFAIGGLSVGEPRDLFFEVLAQTVPLLPDDRPRYLMGVGTPRDLVRAAALGIDMFDCVMPTRLARHGHVFTSEGKANVQNARHRADARPLDPTCTCRVCAVYTRAYIHHLFRAGEALGPRLTTYHNLHVYATLVGRIRAAIAAGAIERLEREVEPMEGLL